MTNPKEKPLDDTAYEPPSMINSVYALIEQQIDLKRNSDVMLSLRERIAMRGVVAAAGREGQAGLSNLRRIDNEEAEKQRIARELHDGLGQLLTSINLHVQQCINRSSSSQGIPEAMKDSLEQISSMTQQAMGEMRGICSALRPAILDDLGVLAAINWQCRQIAQADKSLRVTTDYGVDEKMIPDVYKTAIYRIVQESLNNALKYARAESLEVKLYQAGDYLQLLVRDDGVGFQAGAESNGGGMGLISMRERADAVGGFFELQSGKGQGVEIRVRLPFERVVLSG